MTIKQRFQKNTEAHQKLADVIASDWFAEALVYARASLLDDDVTAEQLDGARKFEAKLAELCRGEEMGDRFPSPGLKHYTEFQRQPTLNKP